MKRVIAVLLLGASIGLAACGGDGESGPEAAASTPATTTTPERSEAAGGGSVAIEGFAFAPKAVKAKVGEEITWTNNDAAAHTVTAKSGGELDSGTLAQGASFSFTPQKAGTIEYFCAIHPSMTGTIELVNG
jgi:plastocyanin